jgi:hypothetical protein
MMSSECFPLLCNTHCSEWNYDRIRAAMDTIETSHREGEKEFNSGKLEIHRCVTC